ncbi:unnamed protein product [Chrysodeixis includens]|uniref:C2H2-type domain-containing protein n=1 Tax=Chrysodeixis includens TaxID=689277 RepID=A0A9P0FY41_CHRIL|nr:unnamed protein product [Chrysodeixis includens]
MACKTSYELHHHFPKLAEESGFTFNTHRPRIHIDWNKIRLIDLDSLIKERKFVIIEQHLNDILDCVLESEFDVRILDDGVMKLFRLAQLAVEYQQFCRHYLDRSVYVLREEITSLAQELDTCKRDLKEKDEEIRRLKKKSRHIYKAPLPYGNDNIATMILKTLSQKGDMFPSTSNDALQYNKCSYCDKVFLNQLYLKSHISRRHGNVIETPQKDKQEINTNDQSSKLSEEINELKMKLQEMETIIANANNQTKATTNTEEKKPNATTTTTNIVETKVKEKVMKDAEVSTNNEDYLLNKIEEWKKEEHENYNKEMNKLRDQIMQTINTFKEKDNDKPVTNEPNVILQLHETIKQQGIEISALKKELIDSRLKTEKDIVARSKEAETQIQIWASRAEAQSKQYELLLQKLNDVARDGKESRALAEAERERATQLQILLQQSLNSKSNGNIDRFDSTDDALTPNKKTNSTSIRKKIPKKKSQLNKTDQDADRKTLENLHRKAQELLNIASITSSSSDISSVENEKQTVTIEEVNVKRPNRDKIDMSNKTKTVEENNQHIIQNNREPQKVLKTKEVKLKKEKPKTNHIKISKEGNGLALPPGSPMKVVRAKITEEVNSRLVSAGVDPLKARLPRSVFQKQRMQIHQLQELKAKKNPVHEKVRRTILLHLDTSTTNIRKEVPQIQDYVSPTKVSKPFKNLTTVISNVKTKALSLVKMNDNNVKEKRKSPSSAVSKRALSLLKTPPGSASNSPVAVKRSPFKAFTTTQNEPPNVHSTSAPSKATIESKDTMSKQKHPIPNSPKSHITETVMSYSEDDSDESEKKYYKTNNTPQMSKSIESLIKSPARRPASATADYNHTIKKYSINDDNLLRTQSAASLIERSQTLTEPVKKLQSKNNDDSSDGAESQSDIPVKKDFLVDNTQNVTKQTKSVLKNASSISSLNKKKVLFDMDAIQMKSVSASPSQSITEKSDGNEKYELGLVNLDGEEWDISSIENEPLKIDTKIQNVTRTSPKIAELKEKIESQLARRNETPTVPLVGRVDVLAGAGSLTKAASLAGSNTSLGSSILDDSESVPIVNHKTFVKSKKVVKEDSDIDISEFSIEGIVNKNESF